MTSHPFVRFPSRRHTGAGLLLLTLALALGACQQSPPDAETATTVAQNRSATDESRAPEFALTDLQGQTVRLSDFEGKVVLIDFWATWCGPCRMEIPHLKELYNRYSEKGFVLVGISLDQAGPGVVRPFVDKNQIPYPIVMGDQQTANAYGGVRSIPTAFLIDRQGRLVKTYVGYKPLETFVADIEPLI
jgi:thiol-disulfide isomerase/thioredoxin